jgi:hypothetical protein
MDSMDAPGFRLGGVRPIDIVGNVFRFQMDKETNSLVFKQKTGTFLSSTILNIAVPCKISWTQQSSPIDALSPLTTRLGPIDITLLIIY